jgi:hypothetical protein
LSSEQYLAWDRPWNTTLGVALSYDTSLHRIPKWFKGGQIFLSNNYQSGYRYTPQKLEGYNSLGRPQYAELTSEYLQKRAKPWFNTDLKMNKTFRFRKRSNQGITFSLEIRNLLNIQNSQIINPVTGEAWKQGSDVPNNWRDPRYVGPEEREIPPGNPARYLAPRQILWGLKFRF